MVCIALPGSESGIDKARPIRPGNEVWTGGPLIWKGGPSWSGRLLTGELLELSVVCSKLIGFPMSLLAWLGYPLHALLAAHPLPSLGLY